MSYLEDDLKLALKRAEPSEDFTARVLARLNDPPRKRTWWEELAVLFQPPRMQWVALSLVASVLIPVAAIEYHRQQSLRAQGEAAKQELVFALRIAGSRLHKVQQKVLEVSQAEHRL